MLSPLLFLALQAATGPQLPAGATPEAKYDACVDAATTAPEQAEKIAGQWRLVGGGFLARQCLGMSYATRQRWTAAAEAFEQAAREAEVAKDGRGPAPAAAARHSRPR